MRLNLRVLLVLLLTMASCSPDAISTEPNVQAGRSLRIIYVEKPGFADSDFKMTFDSDGRPVNYSDISGQNIYRTFQYNSNQQLTLINYQEPQLYEEAFIYEGNLLKLQTAQVNQSAISLEFIYNPSEVQVVRFIDDQFHSTFFFTFSGPELENLMEVKSYDGGGLLRHQYNFEYDDTGNILEQEHYRYDPFTQEMTFNRRISQQYDGAINPFYNVDLPGWMPAWYMAHFEASTFIENISRFSPNNVISRSVVDANGISSNIVFDYEYDEAGYPLNGTRITDGEFDIQRYRFEYFYN